MVSDERMAEELSGTLDSTSFAHLGAPHRGKVRDSYVDAGVRTIVTTDRQSGDGPAPAIPDDVRVATASRYIALAEEITQRPFETTEQTARDRVSSVLASGIGPWP